MRVEAARRCCRSSVTLLIELSATTWIQRLHRYILRRRSGERRRRRYRAQDHSCIRVKPRLCGAARRQATGDYNGISSRLAYELRSPSSTPFRRPRTSCLLRAYPALPCALSLDLLPRTSLRISLSLSLFISFTCTTLLLYQRCAPCTGVVLPTFVGRKDFGVVAGSSGTLSPVRRGLCEW